MCTVNVGCWSIPPAQFSATGVLQAATPFGKPLPSRHYSRGNVCIGVSSGAKPVSSWVVPALAESSLPALPPEDSQGDYAPEDSNREQLGSIERVMVSTTKHSRSARAIANEPEYISERYVRGSLKFQVELSQGFSLDKTATVIEEDEGHKDEKFRQGATETGEVSTAGDSGQLWSSESYLRQALKARYLTQTVKTRKRYKEVILRFPTTNLPVAKQSSKNEDIEDIDDPSDGFVLHSAEESEQLDDEEDLYLRRALNAKRQLASEIFEASLRAGELGPKFTEALLHSMSQFIDRIVTEAVALKKHSKFKELSFNSRARLYVSNVKVVELIKWLKHQNLTAPRIGRLICTADESIGRIKSRIQWLRTIYVKGRDLGVVIERYPQILNLPFQDLNEKVEILETAGVQRKWLGVVVARQPKVLTVSADELREKISMITELGLSAEQFGIMVFRFPAIVGHFSVEEMQLKVDYLRQIGIDNAGLVKILASSPQLLACNIEESWARLLRYFYFLRIEISGVRRILVVNPSVFCLNLEENIAPKVKFLRAIGVQEEAIGQLIVDFPAILTYSLEKKIRPVVRFLLEEAGVTEEKVGKVITLQPELIRCSLPNKLLVLVKYFRSKGFKSSQIGGMIEDFPALLMYSVPALHPKFQYLIRVMKRSLADVVIFPRYFSYSLQSRIVPRHELMQETGLNFSLRHMLACSDDVFSSRIATAEAADGMTSRTWEAEDQICLQESEQNDAMAIDCDYSESTRESHDV
ncbi:unnamed protein product [Calypogeia fissa]